MEDQKGYKACPREVRMKRCRESSVHGVKSDKVARVHSPALSTED